MSMELIARRGDLEAWAELPFDPENDEVELRGPGASSMRVFWQQALKFGYWGPAGDAD